MNDFVEIGNSPTSRFPYKYMLFKGNHEEALRKVIKSRGYERVRMINNKKGNG